MTTQVRSVLDTPIFHKTYNLYKLLHSYQNKIAKSGRYTIWQKCENTTLAILEAVIDAGHRKGNDRLQSLYVISNKLDLLKVLIRLAKDTRILCDKQYLDLEKITQEIGKMIGGWIKFVPC